MVPEKVYASPEEKANGFRRSVALAVTGGGVYG
jgi:hypothetical protein